MDDGRSEQTQADTQLGGGHPCHEEPVRDDAGIYYGWPKNIFHWEGIDKSILDINTTVRPHFSIVDGIVGMEGDGPIMGPPRKAASWSWAGNSTGRKLTVVDATGARIMEIDPRKILISWRRIFSARMGGGHYPAERTDYIGPNPFLS